METPIDQLPTLPGGGLDKRRVCLSEKAVYEACCGTTFSQWLTRITETFSTTGAEGRDGGCDEQWRAYQDCVTVTAHRFSAARVLRGREAEERQ
jgi:hypothetical protein